MIILSALHYAFRSAILRVGDLLLGPAARAAEIVADADARLVWSRRLAHQIASASPPFDGNPRT